MNMKDMTDISLFLFGAGPTGSRYIHFFVQNKKYEI